MVADLWFFNSLGQQDKCMLKYPEAENMINVVSDPSSGNNKQNKIDFLNR